MPWSIGASDGHRTNRNRHGLAIWIATLLRYVTTFISSITMELQGKTAMVEAPLPVVPRDGLGQSHRRSAARVHQ